MIPRLTPALGITLSLLCVGCAADDLSDPTFEHPDSVVARRLTMNGKPDPDYGSVSPSQETVPVTNDQASGLIHLLRRARQETGDQGKACAPRPGVAVEFRRGSETRMVLLCFECDMYGTSANQMKSWHDFDKRRSDLVSWVKQVFPTDPEIQSLKNQ